MGTDDDDTVLMERGDGTEVTGGIWKWGGYGRGHRTSELMMMNGRKKKVKGSGACARAKREISPLELF